MISRKGLITCLVASGIAILGIAIIPKTINNKEINLAELETNNILTESNSNTFIADTEDETASLEELTQKYLKREDIKVFEEKEMQEELNNNIEETLLFKEPNLNTENEENVETYLTSYSPTEIIEIEETKAEELNLNNSVNNIEVFTSSTSPNIVDVVTETAPQEPQPETTAALGNIDYKEMVWNNTKEEREPIYQKGIELLELAKQNGINTSGLDNSFFILDSNAYFAPQGTEKFIEIKKDYENNCYNVLINVTVNPDKSKLNNEALKQLCKLISFNNDNVYNIILNDFTNEVYSLNNWNDTEYGFKIKVSLNEYSKPIYSIKY